MGEPGYEENEMVNYLEKLTGLRKLQRKKGILKEKGFFQSIVLVRIVVESKLSGRM